MDHEQVQNSNPELNILTLAEEIKGGMVVVSSLRVRQWGQNVIQHITVCNFWLHIIAYLFIYLFRDLMFHTLWNAAIINTFRNKNF